MENTDSNKPKESTIITKAARPALILVDIQQAFDDIEYWGGQRNNPDAVLRASELLQLWREHGLPLFHIQHCSSTLTSPLHETNPGNRFNEMVTPAEGEPVIQKNVNSAFIGTDLKARLDDAKITTLVIVGLTTDHCVSTTTRMAGNLGYKTFLVADATATFNKKGINGQNYSAELIHETALASLNDEFATVVSSDFIKQSILAT
ncbi:cysteine hydrolase family protein [Mucilaginibacter flavidus]|uniref:cysteine hydrolase family protein n=1 Tax=Mucilaginibacter flavidus TaxID=2949309 RepID=UPI00209279F9|nr:cysteine hydrolase family protein [Mucilaginibacter flavidus]MCO5948346.1 cysteine hydrolase [Mucilaginibacter flavidus]